MIAVKTVQHSGQDLRSRAIAYGVPPLQWSHRIAVSDVIVYYQVAVAITVAVAPPNVFALQ
jgi:hypothetical protein